MITDLNYAVTGSAPSSPEFTGIPLLDGHLAATVASGGVVLVSGNDKSGKTMLGSQIAAHLAMGRHRVDFISTQASGAELHARMLSSAIGWPFEELEGGRIKYADIGTDHVMPWLPRSPRSDEFSQKALGPCTRLRKDVVVHYVRDFRESPLKTLEDLLEQIRQLGAPRCLVLDELQVSGLSMTSEGKDKTVNVPETAANVMRKLQKFAKETGTVVFVTCHRKPAPDRANVEDRELGRVGEICEFPSIVEHVDAEIELTDPISHISDRRRGEGMRLSERYLIFRSGGSSLESRIPVTFNTDFQRFDAREEPEIGRNEFDLIFHNEVARNSKRKGFIKFPRDLWKELCEIRHVPTRAVYLALVLNADPNSGQVVCSEELLRKALGVHRNVARRALENLVNDGFISDATKRTNGFKQSRRWQIRDYESLFQNRHAQDYVVIARNILDENREDLRHDVKAFALWLELLFEVKYIPDRMGICDRGCWSPDFFTMAQRLRCEQHEVREAIRKLEQQGRVRRLIDPTCGDEVFLLPNFDAYQRQVPWQKGLNAGTRMTGQRGEDTPEKQDNGAPKNGPSTGQRQDIDEPTTGHRRAIDGPYSNQGIREAGNP